MTDAKLPHKMWGGRFSQPPDPELLAFTSSFSFDQRLLRWDLLGSIAHAEMLGATGIIPADDARQIADGLRTMLRGVEAGNLVPTGAHEDVHTFIEATLYDRIGPAAGRLHTARSRNDQVVTAFRLYLKEQLTTLAGLMRDLMAAIIERAAGTIDVIMPGFTHLQHAQPVRLAHHLLAYLWMLDRDAQRCIRCYESADALPLGSGAVAGVNLPVDRQRVADALGFSRLSENSIDATGDRDFAAEAIFTAALLLVHLSRWAGEIVTWATEEFGFVRLSDAVAHGSSLMPQKKNPDAAELVRGKTGRTIGDLTALLAMLKGLPLGYNMDLQEDKPAVFDALDAASAALRAMRRLFEGLEFMPDRMLAAARAGQLTATDLADYLVRKGVPFREAHDIAGRVVQSAIRRDVPLWELPIDAYREASSLFEPDVLEAVRLEVSVEARQAPGGTARESVVAQLAAARARVRRLQSWLAEASAAVDRAAALAGR